MPALSPRPSTPGSSPPRQGDRGRGVLGLGACLLPSTRGCVTLDQFSPALCFGQVDQRTPKALYPVLHSLIPELACGWRKSLLFGTCWRKEQDFQTAPPPHP